MLKLYHHHTSVCAAKSRLVLAEKALEFDGVARNWMLGKAFGFDTTIGAALNHSLLKASARRDYAVTDALEKTKEKLKAGFCAAMNLDFVCVSADSNGTLGAKPMAIIKAGYSAKLEAAQTPAEKWAVRNEVQNHMALLGHAIMRRNAAMLFTNARPLAGGWAPKAELPLEAKGAEHLSLDWD